MPHGSRNSTCNVRLQEVPMLLALPKAGREVKEDEGREERTSATSKEPKSAEQRQKSHEKPSGAHWPVSPHSGGPVHRPTSACSSADT